LIRIAAGVESLVPAGADATSILAMLT